MSEGRKNQKLSLRELLEEMAEDDGIDLRSRETARAEVKKLPKKAVVKHHPDHGGDRDKFESIVQARKQALIEVGQK